MKKYFSREIEKIGYKFILKTNYCDKKSTL